VFGCKIADISINTMVDRYPHPIAKRSRLPNVCIQVNVPLRILELRETYPCVQQCHGTHFNRMVDMLKTLPHVEHIATAQVIVHFMILLDTS
jgi:hypothetical protein